MNYESWSSSSSSIFLAELFVKGPTKTKVQNEKKSNLKLPHPTLLTFVSVTFDDI